MTTNATRYVVEWEHYPLDRISIVAHYPDGKSRAAYLTRKALENDPIWVTLILRKILEDRNDY